MNNRKIWSDPMGRVRRWVLLAVMVFFPSIGLPASREKVSGVVGEFGPTVVCTASQLRLHQQPDISSSSIGVLKKGEISEIVEIKSESSETIDGIDSCWIKVRVPSGEEGWVFGGYLEDIFSAIHIDDVEAVKALLRGGVDPNSPLIWTQAVCDGKTVCDYPLFSAVDMGSMEMVNVLLSFGASVDVGTKPGALSLLMMARTPEMVSRLIKAMGDLNVKDSDGWTPLMLADYYEYGEIASLFRKAGAREDPTNRAKFVLALKAGDQGKVRLLLEDLGSVNFTIPREGTPLQVLLNSFGRYASREKASETAGWLIHAGAYLQDVLVDAVKIGDPELVLTLLKAGADRDEVGEIDGDDPEAGLVFKGTALDLCKKMLQDSPGNLDYQKILVILTNFKP